MKKALLYKEFKKTKKVWFAICIIGIALLAYMFSKIGRSFRFAGLEHLMDVIINRNQFLFRELKFFPLLAGISIGVAQYVPEMLQKRIKLTLHLPLKERSIILQMLLHGLVLLVSLFAFHIIATLVFATIYLPNEIVFSTFITILPWYIAGITAYLFVAVICLDPTWKRRIMYIILACGSLYLFFISTFPGAYMHILAWLIILPIYIVPFTFLSVARFKNGEQD